MRWLDMEHPNLTLVVFALAFLFVRCDCLCGVITGGASHLSSDSSNYCDYARHELPRPTVHRACITGYSSAFDKIASFFHDNPIVVRARSFPSWHFYFDPGRGGCFCNGFRGFDMVVVVTVRSSCPSSASGWYHRHATG